MDSKVKRILAVFSVLVLVFCVTANLSYAKVKVNQSNPNGFLAFAEKMPQPIGGLKAIYKHIKKYPTIAEKAGIQGKVYLLAYVDETGKCSKVDVVKGIGGGCDEAAIEAIKKTKYKPGMHKGKKVKVKLSLSIVFKLK